jgi:hypothetical protein
VIERMAHLQKPTKHRSPIVPTYEGRLPGQGATKASGACANRGNRGGQQ